MNFQKHLRGEPKREGEEVNIAIHRRPSLSYLKKARDKYGLT